MTEQIRIRPVIGLVMLQAGLFQLTLWAYLAGDLRLVITSGLINLASLLGVGSYYLYSARTGRSARPVARPLRAGEGQGPITPGDRYRALALGTLGFLVTFMVWGSISPLALEYKQMYDLSNTQVSLLIAVPVLLGSIGRLGMGVLADRFGPRRVHALLMAFLILPLIAMGFTRSFTALMVVAFFIGMAGSSFAVGVPFVSRWFPAAQQGLALGIYGVGNFGQALAVMFVPRIATAIGWAQVYWVLTIPVALTGLAIWLLGKDGPRPAGAAKGASGESVWSSPQAWLLSLFYFVSFGGFVAFSNYLPKLYQELHVMSAAQAGSFTAIFVLVATLARPLGGWLSDKLNADRVLLVIFASALGGALALTGSPSFRLFTLAVALLALALGIGNGAVFKLVPQFFPGKTGAVTGMVGAMGGLGGFFPPLVLGLVRDQMGSYALGFVGLAAFATLCITGVAVLMRGRREEAAALERA